MKAHCLFNRTLYTARCIVILVLALIALALPINARCDEIHDVAASGDLRRTEELVKENPGVVNAKDPQERTPLHLAILNGHRDIAKLLLSNNADVNCKDAEGLTPLHMAALYGYANVADLLLALHADVNAHGTATVRAPVGREPTDTPRYVATIQNPDAGSYDYPTVAVADLTPLHLATSRGFGDVVRLLLAHGADVNARDETGRTALHYVARQPEGVGLRIVGNVLVPRLQGSPQATIKPEEPEAHSVVWPEERLAELLTAHGTDLMALDRHGMTPVDAAGVMGSRSVVDVLLRSIRTRATVVVPSSHRVVALSKLRALSIIQRSLIAVRPCERTDWSLRSIDTEGMLVEFPPRLLLVRRPDLTEMGWHISDPPDIIDYGHLDYGDSDEPVVLPPVHTRQAIRSGQTAKLMFKEVTFAVWAAYHPYAGGHEVRLYTTNGSPTVSITVQRNGRRRSAGASAKPDELRLDSALFALCPNLCRIDHTRPYPAKGFSCAAPDRCIFNGSR